MLYYVENKEGRVHYVVTYASLDYVPEGHLRVLESNLQEVVETGYIKNGTIKTSLKSPSNFHTWDNDLEIWLPDLDAARESQRQAWTSWRDRELVAGYVHEGHRFHTDDGFMGELHLLLKGYEEGLITGTSSIRTMTNEVLQKTGAEIKTLLLILGLHRQAIYQQSWVGKDALTSLTTLEDIIAGGPPE